MVGRIILFTFLPCLVIALLLHFAGVEQVVFGDTYYLFFKNVTNSYNSWHIAIPDIPTIPKINNQSVDSAPLVLVFLVNFANALFTLFNGIIKLLNFVIMVINIAISLIQFALTMIYQCKDFITSLS